MPHFIADFLTSTQWIGTFATGLAYAAAVLGVFLTFRILSFPDLTIDGSFPLGAGVAAVLAIRGWSHWATLPVAALCGGLGGAATAWLAARLKINGLLASILVALALYSINLRIYGLADPQNSVPTANIQLLNHQPAPHMIDQDGLKLTQSWRGYCFAVDACMNQAAVVRYAQIMVFGLVTAIVAFGLYWLLNTEVGLALRAVGDNAQMVRAQGISAELMQLLGLALSNGLIALSGALVVATSGYADVTLGRGLIIVGLAAVIIGEVVVSPKGLRTALAGAVLGSILYRLFVAFSLRYVGKIGLQETDLQLLTALIVIAALGLPQLRRWIVPQRAAR